MYENYKDDVEFFLVYIREAHPTDDRRHRAKGQSIQLKQPTTYGERVAVAKTMCRKLDLKMPPLVDRLNDKVNRAYNAEPDRLYLVGVDGRVAYQSAPGPRGFKPPNSREQSNLWSPLIDGMSLRPAFVEAALI